jgi:CubicO group peptidase (beta-lactamase class C family)
VPEHWQPITILHLLNHRSGLSNFTDYHDYAGTQRLPSTPWQTMDRFRDAPLVSAVGEVSRYNNSGYIILGALVELISGKTYADFLTEKLFQPLRMFDSGYDNSEQVLSNRARGYVRTKQATINACYLDMSIPFSAGALYSTIDDLYLFDQAIAKGKKPIPAQVLKTMAGEIDDTYSAGWHTDNSNGRLKVGHSGGIDGFCTIMLRLPQEKLTIIVLSNVVSWLYSPERIAQELSSIVFDEPYEIPRIRKAIKLDSPEYDDYTGMYELENLSMHLKVEREHGRWFLQFTDQESFEIFPETENQFFVLDFEAQVEFCFNARKQVTHVILAHEGQVTRAYKLK